MKLRFIFLFVLAILSFTYGQQVVPLSIGNKWIYIINGISNNVESYKVVSDTIISGQKFSKIKYTSGTYITYEYWRADSNQFYINSSLPFASGVKYDRDSTKWKAEDIELSEMDFLNFKNRKVQKAYTNYVMIQHIWSYTYTTAEGFGLVEIYNGYTDEVQGYSSNTTALIKGALINGVVYGDTTMPPPPPPKPAAPKLTAIAGNNLIELKWSKFKGNDFKMYNVYKTDYTTDSLLKSITDINDTTMMIDGLTNGITYYFEVNSVNLNGITSDFSDVAGAKPASYTLVSKMNGIFTPDLDNNGFNGIMNQQGLNFVLYINKAGTFVKTDSFPALEYGNISWADYNNDGSYDLFYSGEDSNDNTFSVILKNVSGNFKNVNARITGVVASSIDWADYDNDGYLDFILTGDPSDPYEVITGDPNDPYKQVTELYRNDGNDVFTEVKLNFPGIVDGSATWGDYDNDGDQDLLLCGLKFIKVYENVKGDFKEVLNFKGYDNRGTWGDFNNDGFLDFCVVSADTFNQNENNGILKVFKNNGDKTFSEYTIATSLQYSTPYVIDYNNDGNLDIVIPAENIVFQNNGNFNFKKIPLPGSSFADYDNDGDLDIMGKGGIFRNNTIFTEGFNTRKNLNPPINLSAEVSQDGSVKISWSKPVLNYPSEVLSYNIRLGSTSNGIDIISPMSNLTTGRRLKLAIGNAGFDTSKTINNLPDGTYYWSVQSVDNNYNGSVFAKEQRFTISNEKNEIPLQFSLLQNYPDPFNPSTTIEYSIPHIEDVTLKIYDVLGRLVTTLVSGEKSAGNYTVEFNGSNLSSGIYFYQIQAGNFVEAKKMILLK